MKRSHLAGWATTLLLLLFFALALTSAVQKSPTMDEQNHIARGTAYLATGDPRLSIEHPPLVNLLSALPVYLLLRPRLPLDTIWWEAAEWYHFADLFLWEVNVNAEQIVFLARLPIVGLGMTLIALVYRWGQQRFNHWGGLVGAAFCALDPNLLAHTRLSTTDVGGTLFGFVAAYALWRALRRPSPLRVVAASLGLGLAFSAKLSTLLLGAVLGLTVLVDGIPGGPGRVRRILGRSALMLVSGVLALLTVWAIYGYDIGPVAGSEIVIPAPPYVQGVQAILDFAAGGRPGYLLGQVSNEGWWTYFPVAFAVKTPLATLAGLAGATGLLLGRRSRDDLFLLLPPALFFALSTFARLNLGYRHLLPMLPFLFVHLGRLAPPAGPSSGRRVRALLPSLLIMLLLAATLCIYPHFLPFFNRLGGGSEGGWRVLADSNIDWGQDMKGLKRWMEQEGVEQVRLAWFGTAQPEYYGVAYDLLPGVPYGLPLWANPPFDPDQPEPGTYAISASNLVGVALPDPDLYAWFREREPAAKIGYSIFIFEVPP